MPVVQTKTRAEYDELMDILDKKWAKWRSKESNKAYDAWKTYENNTCIEIDDLHLISFADIEYYTEQRYRILSLNDYKKMNDIKEVCEFKRGERISISDDTGDEYEERIFISYIEWASSPYVCVDCYHNLAYANWEPFDITSWKYALEKKKISSEDIQKAKKLLIETWEKWATF